MWVEPLVAGVNSDIEEQSLGGRLEPDTEIFEIVTETGLTQFHGHTSEDIHLLFDIIMSTSSLSLSRS